MTKAIKKSIAFVTSLILVLCIIAVIMCMFSGCAPKENAPDASPDTTDNPATADEESPAPPDASSVLEISPGDWSEYANRPAPNPDAAGISYTLTVPEGFANDTEDESKIVCTEDENTYIKFNFYSDTSASELSPGFLDKYIDYIEISYDGVTPVDGTNFSARTISAANESYSAKAWLMERNGGVFSAVLIWPVGNDALYDSLVSVLESLNFE